MVQLAACAAPGAVKSKELDGMNMGLTLGIVAGLRLPLTRALKMSRAEGNEHHRAMPRELEIQLGLSALPAGKALQDQTILVPACIAGSLNPVSSQGAHEREAKEHHLPLVRQGRA